MSNRTNLFLDQFDIGFRSHVIEFAKRLTELSKSHDVLIFLARKAACLADCLDEIGLSKFHCVITSSRVLDMDLKWMRGKRVAIIDDALISGTTINQALRKLEANGIQNVKVSVLSIDNYWWNRELVSPEKPYFELDSNQTSQLCANIVQSISVLPRPYTIDYPLFKNIRIRSEDFNELSNSGDWIVYEATSSHQDQHGIINLTIIPSDETCLRFLEKLGINLDTNFLFKLRLYALKTKSIYWCQVLPIVILPPIEIGELEKMFNRITESASHSSLEPWFQVENEEDEISAKLRFVQYYLATQLGYAWHDGMMRKIDVNIIFEQDFKNINFLFPPPISDQIKELCIQDHVSFEDLKIAFSNTPNDESIEREDSEFDETIALHKLSNPFLNLYKDKELAARKLVREKGQKVFEDPQYKAIIDRLNEGYSLRDLREFVSNVAGYINKGKLVSYFLDLFIDKGVVVPITCVKNGVVFRAFRHGEDVEFSENEIRLCMAMLHKFSNEYGSTQLPHTIVEKLLVLFIRIGIQKNYLTVSTAPLSDFQSIGIRYYLHGAVVGSFDKKIYKVNMSNSLTSVLVEAGYLQRKVMNDDYTLSPTPTSGAHTRGLSDANLIGTIFGNLMKESRPKINLDDLILISTIPTLIDAVGALAAEIYIFQSFYTYEKHKYFLSFTSNRIRSFRSIRKKMAFTALNSGTWKYENFKTGAAWKTIEKCSRIFDNSIYGDVWNTFWPSMGKQTSNTSANPELAGLFERLADWLYTTRFYINLIEVALTKSRDEFRKGPAIHEMQQMLISTKINQPLLYNHLNRLFDTAYSKFLTDELKRPELYDYCVGKLEDNFQFSRQLLSEVDSIATNFGKIERVVFCEHVVLLDYKKFSQPISQVKAVFNKVIHEVQIEAKKHDFVQFFEIPHHYSAIKTGTWVCANGKNARQWLLKFVSKLTDALDSIAALKATFFLNLDFFRICKRLSSNEYEAPLFWDIAKGLLRKKFKLSEGHELIYFTSKADNKSAIENEIKNELPSFQKLEGKNKITEITTPYNLKFISSHYTKSSMRTFQNIMDIGIITIVTPELIGVTDEFEANRSFREAKGTIVARTYRFGTLKDGGGNDLNVVVVQAKEQGNRSIISSYDAMSNEFNPQLIVLLGIGGSIHKDVGICDVVIANSVVYYDKRAETEDGIERRGEGFKLGSYSIDLIQNFQFAHKAEEPVLPAAENSPATVFKTIVGPIGTGEAVLKYRNAEEREWLLKFNSKTLVVETEAAGFAQQFYEDDLNYSRRAKGILIIRGVSDKADEEKNDKWRLAASKNAMTVLREIIKSNNFR